MYLFTINCHRLHSGTGHIHIQSTLVISKSKGPSETLRDIRTSTYQICRIEENTILITEFHKWTCNLTPLVRNTCWKYCGKGVKLLLRSNFLLLFTVFSQLMLDFYVKTRIRFCLRVKRLFEITEVEITRVDCICIAESVGKEKMSAYSYMCIGQPH